MRKFLGAAAIAMLLTSSPLLAQSASSTTSASKVTTTNGKVTSASAASQKASCRNDKGQFIKCSTVTKVSSTATITKDANGKCRFSAGPKKGQFTKCP